MFRAVLYAQWKWSRLVIVAGVIAGFAIPVLSLQLAGAAALTPGQAGELLQSVQSWGVLYPTLAAALGVLAAIATWAPDHRGRHVYALSLPIARWRYVLLRFGAGAVLLIAPAIAVLAGALLATATATLPPGLHGYAIDLALRFTLALLVAFAVFFAISSGTARTAGAILAVIGALAVVQVLAATANIDLGLVEAIQRIFVAWPGPFAVFTGRWMLIDV